MDSPHRESGTRQQNSPSDTVPVNDFSAVTDASPLGQCSMNSTKLGREPTTPSSSTAEESDEQPFQQAGLSGLSNLLGSRPATSPNPDYSGDDPDRGASLSPKRKKVKLTPETADVEVATPVLPAIPPGLFEEGPSIGAAGRCHESIPQNAKQTSCMASACLHQDIEPPASSDHAAFHSSTGLLPSDAPQRETVLMAGSSVFELPLVTETAPPQPVSSPTINTVMASGGPRMDSHQTAGSADRCPEPEMVAVSVPSAAGRSTLQPNSDIFDLERLEELRHDESDDSSSSSSSEAAQDPHLHLPSPAYAVHQSSMHGHGFLPSPPAWSPPSSPPPFQPVQPQEFPHLAPPEFLPFPPSDFPHLPAPEFPPFYPPVFPPLSPPELPTFPPQFSPVPPPDLLLFMQLNPLFNDLIEMALLEAEDAEYFELTINLDEILEEPVPPGLSQGQIERLVTYQLTPEMSESDAEPCIMCANHYQAEELMRVLPCGHEFHSPCIDTWLQINRACPFCRCDASTGTANAGEDS